MPLYEYFCPKCSTTYELLHPMSRSDDPGVCPKGRANGARTITAFASVTRATNGDYAPIPSSGGGCACGNGACGCGH